MSVGKVVVAKLCWQESTWVLTKQLEDAESKQPSPVVAGAAGADGLADLHGALLEETVR